MLNELSIYIDSEGRYYLYENNCYYMLTKEHVEKSLKDNAELSVCIYGF